MPSPAIEEARKTLSQVKSYGLPDFLQGLFIFPLMGLLVSAMAFLSKADDEAARADNLRVSWNSLIFFAVFAGPTYYAMVTSKAYKKRVFAVLEPLSDLELAKLSEPDPAGEWIRQEFIRRGKRGAVNPLAQILVKWRQLGTQHVLTQIGNFEAEISEYFQLRAAYRKAVVSHPKLRIFYLLMLPFPICAFLASRNPELIFSPGFMWIALFGLYGAFIPFTLMLGLSKRATRPERNAIKKYCQQLPNVLLYFLAPFGLGPVSELKDRSKAGDTEALELYKSAVRQVKQASFKNDPFS